MIKSRKLVLRFIVLLCVAYPAARASASAGPAVQANVRDVGPKGLLLTYKCLPSSRAALRKYMSGTGLQELNALQSAGVLAGKTILFSRYVDTDNWDLLIFLDFSSPEQMQKWNQLEHTEAAGFEPEGLKLVTAISTYQIDLVQAKSSPSPSAHPVYMVLPYDYTVSTDAYLEYLKGYVAPQMSGWIEAGPLSSYRMFVGRGVADRPWSAVILLAYQDDEALGRRDVTVAAVRARLKNDPGWKALSDNKQTVRKEKAPIIADEIR